MQAFLLRSLLRRYSSGRPASPEWAARSWREESVPELLRIACDAWDIPLGELARAAGLEQTVLARFIMGTRPLALPEAKAVTLEMHAMIGRVDRG